MPLFGTGKKMSSKLVQTDKPLGKPTLPSGGAPSEKLPPAVWMALCIPFIGFIVILVVKYWDKIISFIPH